MSTNTLTLSSDLDAVSRVDALTGIREALWGIHARNILRSVVEEVASEDGEKDEESNNYDTFLGKSKSSLENHSIDIEVIDGLNLAVTLGYNRRNQNFAAIVNSVTLETNGKTFILNEKFALEMNVDILGKDSNSNFDEFVDFHQKIANSTPTTGDDSQIDILIDLLFDFTDIESVW